MSPSRAENPRRSSDVVEETPIAAYSRTPNLFQERVDEKRWYAYLEATWYANLPKLPPPVSKAKPAEKEVVVAVVEAPATESDCGPHVMSISEAHQCWDSLITCAHSDGQGNCDSYRDWDTAKAFHVMYCESKGKYNAYNPSGASGLFQILGGPMDPGANVNQAYEMWLSRGWGPWVCQ